MKKDGWPKKRREFYETQKHYEEVLKNVVIPLGNSEEECEKKKEESIKKKEEVSQ